MANNTQMTTSDWELKEKRELAARCYNSFAINNPDMKHEDITKRVEKVIEWLFDTYSDNTEVKEADVEL
jgi:hypothetical protein